MKRSVIVFLIFLNLLIYSSVWDIFKFEKEDLILDGLFIATATFGVTFMDEFIREETQKRFNTEFSDTFFRTVNILGEGKYILPGMLLTLGISHFVKADRIKALMQKMILTFTISGLFITAVRYPLGRERPFHEKGNYSFKPFSGRESFPSGHTQVIFSVLMSIGYEFGIEKYMIPTAFVFSFARVYLDRHWFSDVFFSGVITTLIAKKVNGVMIRNSNGNNILIYEFRF